MKRKLEGGSRQESGLWERSAFDTKGRMNLLIEDIVFLFLIPSFERAMGITKVVKAIKMKLKTCFATECQEITR